MLTIWRKKGFMPAVSQGFAEGVLVQQRRADGHHHAIELELLNVLLDQFLPGVRAHVLVVAGNGDVGQIGREVGDLLAVHHRGDVDVRNGRRRLRRGRSLWLQT